ncbi:MAG TPA: XRE family transcriptional regulator [Gemmataceae bacterium]
MTKAYRTTAADAVLARFPPARRAKIKARAAEIVAEEFALSDLRKSKEMTQEEVAERLGGRQVYVSRLERRSDMKLSTLRDYVKAIGGRLQLVVTFPKGEAVRLKDIGDDTAGNAVARRKGARGKAASRTST